MKSLEKKGQEIAEKISVIFENKSYILSLTHRYHFMVRLYRTTGNKDFINPIIENFLLKKDEHIEHFNNIDNAEYVEKKAKQFFDNILKKRKGIKSKKRIELFRDKKELFFYYRMMQNLYFWKEFGMDKSPWRKYFQKCLKFLKKFTHTQDFEKFFFDQDMIKYFGTQLINCVYYLKFLKVTDIRKKFTNRFKTVFDNEYDKNLPKYLYKNKVYGLTHFIIADTNYYQRYSSPQKFNWILSYFKNNIKDIITKTNVDIISEVGLCFKLCKENTKELNRIRKYVIEHYDKKKGYIPRHNSINSSEHTDAVAYLFLSNFKKLYQGPDIGKQVEKYAKKF